MRDADGRLLRTWKGGEAKLNAYLEDHAFLVEALLTLYESTFEQRWFDAARETADPMIERFADPERGGFFTTSDDHEELIARRKDVDDHPIPTGNSSAALGLLRLAALTGERSYGDRAPIGLRALRPRRRAPPGRGRPPAAGASTSTRPRCGRSRWSPPTSAASSPSWPRSSARELRPHLVLAGGAEGSERARS